MVKQTAKYLEMQIKTAGKEQLLLMLFDGAIKFAEQAKMKITAKEIEASHNLLIKAQRIIMELIVALDKKAIDAATYKNLTGLYTFVYLRLVEANIKRKPELVDEAIKILNNLRITWTEAIMKMKESAHPSIEVTSNIPGETEKSLENISLQG
ncbi:MAG: flagellar export chaperone FliS [Planctomycetes bacterium]|nr:flagellar export chaperone FliS [Planctomycetota bacterium]